MADLLFDNLDADGFALLKSKLDPRGSDPATPWVPYMLWTLTGDNTIYMAITTTTKVGFRQTGTLITNGDLAGGIALSKLATDPLARANHTGTQLASTISDFNSAASAAVAGDISSASTADRNRANHTGTQASTTISDFASAAQTAITEAIVRARLAAATADIAVNGQKVTGVANPVSAQDAATKSYVDGAVQGLDAKQSVKAASTGNLGTGSSGPASVDGVALTINDRILYKDQTNPAENGIYRRTSTANTNVVRVDDMDVWDEVPGAFVFVEQGTVNADSGWVSTADQGGTLGTTAIPWVQFSGAGQIDAGAGLTKTGNQLNVGAGTGVSVAADTVGIDTTVVARKTRSTITGDGTTTVFTVTHHDLGTSPVPDVTVKRNSDNKIGRVGVESVSATSTKVTVLASGGSAVPNGVTYTVQVVG